MDSFGVMDFAIATLQPYGRSATRLRNDKIRISHTTIKLTGIVRTDDPKGRLYRSRV